MATTKGSDHWPYLILSYCLYNTSSLNPSFIKPFKHTLSGTMHRISVGDWLQSVVVCICVLGSCSPCTSVTWHWLIYWGSYNETRGQWRRASGPCAPPGWRSPSLWDCSRWPQYHRSLLLCFIIHRAQWPRLVFAFQFTSRVLRDCLRSSSLFVCLCLVVEIVCVVCCSVYLPQHGSSRDVLYGRSLHPRAWHGGGRRTQEPHPLPPWHWEGQCQVHEESNEGTKQATHADARHPSLRYICILWTQGHT